MSAGTQPRILLAVTELGSSGGLQLLNEQMAVCIDGFADATTLSLHGPRRIGIRSGAREVLARGFGGRKIAFARAVRAAAKGHDLAILAHPNFGALVPGARARLCAVMAFGVDGWMRQSWARRRGLRRADALIAISASTMQRTIDAQGLPRDHPPIRLVLQLGLAPEKSPDRPSAPAAAPTILSVSRLAAEDSYKGIDDVIAALPEIREVVPDVRYVVIGDGDDRPRLEALARSTGVAGSVAFAGRVSDEDLRAAYASATMFALPSSEEGFGLVFIEAMAWGLPVVAADAAAAPEVVMDGRTGTLVPKGDRAALAKATIRTLTDHDLARRFGEQGRALVHDRYLLAHFEARLEALCRGLLEEGTSPSPG